MDTTPSVGLLGNLLVPDIYKHNLKYHGLPALKIWEQGVQLEIEHVESICKKGFHDQLLLLASKKVLDEKDVKLQLNFYQNYSVLVTLHMFLTGSSYVTENDAKRRLFDLDVFCLYTPDIPGKILTAYARNTYTREGMDIVRSCFQIY